MSLVDAFGVIVVAEARGLEELLEAAVIRVNSERAVMVREPMFRERMMQHPAVLLRLYQGISMEEDPMMVEEERKVDTMNSGGVLRACYGCGACSTGLYCTWCGYRPTSR